LSPTAQTAPIGVTDIRWPVSVRCLWASPEATGRR